MNENRKKIIAITHDHAMYSLAARRKQGECAVFENHFAPAIHEGGVNLIGWVTGGDPPFFGIEHKDPWWGTLELLDMLWQEHREKNGAFNIIQNRQDLEALRGNEIALLISIEGGAILDAWDGSDPLVKLRTLFRSGVRSLQIVGQDWNQLTDAKEAHPIPSNGLTPTGKNVIREMNKLGMVIDLSHIPDPDPVFEDIIEITQHPVIDSHRGVRGVSDIDRNIGDTRIKTIAQTGGVIGLQFFSISLNGQAGVQAKAEDLIRHINHIVSVAGIDHVSLGPDFLDPALLDRGPGYYIEDLEDISKIRNLEGFLGKHGYSDEDIRKIMGENMIRVYRTVLN